MATLLRVLHGHGLPPRHRKRARDKDWRSYIRLGESDRVAHTRSHGDIRRRAEDRVSLEKLWDVEKGGLAREKLYTELGPVLAGQERTLSLLQSTEYLRRVSTR